MSSSEYESDDEAEYVLYRDRAEWRDVTPSDPEAGKPFTVVNIAYSEEFKDCFDYFRAICEKREYSARALELTRDCIRHNAANYTVWEYRRRILKELNADLAQEFDYCDKVIAKNIKNFQIWHHRQVLCESTKDGSREIELTTRIFKKDQKNYHAWQHRQWAIKRFGLFDGELEFTEKNLEADIYNNSVWNHRHFIIQNTTGWAAAQKRELEFVLSKINEAIDNESAWNYLRAIMQHKLTDFPIVSKRMEEWKETDMKVGTHAQLAAFQADYFSQLYAKDRKEQHREQAFGMLKALSSELDPIRRNYWEYLSSALMSEEKS